MSYSGIDQLQLPVSKARPWLDSLARRSLHRALNNLSVGRLVIEEAGQVFEYGQTTDATDLVARVSVRNPSVYRDVLMRGTIGAGESYMQGHWTSRDLLSVIRVFVSNMAVIEQMDSNLSLVARFSNGLTRLFTINTRGGSRRNIGAHYDLGNDFFRLFLDRNMMYSAAVYPSPEADLETAARYKLEKICEKLDLQPGDHLLEIGTGWGGMAVYAAKHYGCRVTTTTISRQQYEFALQRVREAGLEDRVEVLLQDYRELNGRYDKIVSIEMVEAVGPQYYPVYFQKVSQLLKPHGLMVMQAITIPDQRYRTAKGRIDFIQKYIFPGGALPSNAVIAHHLGRDTDMQLVGLEDITHHYARTLADWRASFMRSLDLVRAQGYGKGFIKMWEFYLCYCEGGFTERVINTGQFVFAKPAANLQALEY